MLASTDFASLLWLTAAPMLQLLALVVGGLILFRLSVLDASAVDVLARLVLTVTLPCMIVDKVVMQFRPYSEQFAHWYIMPLAAFVIVGVAAVLSGAVAHWVVPFERRRAFRVVCSFHNAGYLNIPIVAVLYSQGTHHGRSADEMLVVLFLFILGISPLMWSVGVKWLRTDGRDDDGPSGSGLRKLLSPPFLANVLAIGVCLLNLPTWVSSETLGRVLAPVHWTGQATIPLIMLSLGGILAELRGARRPPVRSIMAAMGLRFVLFPIVGWAVLGGLAGAGILAKPYAVILFLQTIMPTATGMAVAARRYGTTETSEFVNGAVFVLYLVALVAIPVWLMIWALTYGFAIG